MSDFRFAIMGAGRIANKFCEAVALTQGCCVAAVASKSQERAETFARDHGIPAAYGDYEQMLLEEKPDCVYIATTTDAHFPLTMLCLKHHTPVLCEKAMFMTQAEAATAFRAAREKNVFLMEGLWSRFLPAVNKARTWVKEGRIGVPAMGDMGLGFKAQEDPSNRYLNPDLGGGATFDLTVYGIQVLSWVLDREILRVKTEAVRGETGVDVNELVLLRFAGKVPAVIRAGFMSPVEERLVICGSQGRIVIPRAHCAKEAYLYDTKGNELEHFVDEETVNGFTWEVEEAMRCIGEGKIESPVVPHASTLVCAGIYDRIRQEMDEI